MNHAVVIILIQQYIARKTVKMICGGTGSYDMVIIYGPVSTFH